MLKINVPKILITQACLTSLSLASFYPTYEYSEFTPTPIPSLDTGFTSTLTRIPSLYSTMPPPSSPVSPASTIFSMMSSFPRESIEPAELKRQSLNSLYNYLNIEQLNRTHSEHAARIITTLESVKLSTLQNVVPYLKTLILIGQTPDRLVQIVTESIDLKTNALDATTEEYSVEWPEQEAGHLF